MSAFRNDTAKRLVVVGAANGIGRATVELARSRGWEVAEVDREPAVGEAPLRWQCDVGDPVSVATAFDHILATWPEGFNAVVHTAGVFRIGPASEISSDQWDHVLRVNARGSALVAKEAARGLRISEAEDRSIVFLSSIAAQRGYSDEPSPIYAASKGAVESLSRHLAVEWGPSGIRVNAVAPGIINTQMPTITDDPQAAEKFFREAVPLGRIGEPEEVAEVCLFLASRGSRYITGTVIPVDGGEGAQ